MARALKQEFHIVDKGTPVIKKAGSDIRKELDKTQAASSKVTSAMSLGWGKIATFIGAGAVVGSIKKLASETLTYGDKLHKLNLRLGINVTELDKLRQVADLSGVSFDSLTMGLQRMTYNVNQASKGTGEAKNALAELGLSAQDLTGLSIEEQFKKISGRLVNVSDSAKKAALGMQIFGGRGASLLQMMPGLNENLDKTQSSFSQKNTQQIAAFNDKMTMLKDNFLQIAVNISEKLLPAWNLFLNQLNKAPMDPKLDKLNEELKYVNQQLKETKFISDDMLRARKEGPLLKRMKELRAEMNALMNEARVDTSLTNFFSELDGGVKQTKTSIEDMTKYLNTSYVDSWMKFKELSEEKLEANSRAWDIIIAQDEEAIKKKEKLYIQDAMNFKNTEIEKMQGMDAANERSQKLLQDNQDKTKAGYDKINHLIASESVSAINTFNSELKKSGNAIDALKESFISYAASFMDKIADMIIEQTIMNALQSSQSNSGGGSGDQQSSMWGSIMSSVVSAATSSSSAKGNVFNNGNLQAFVKGGILDRPTFFPMRNGMGLAGEAGPEAVMPLKRNSEGRLGVEASNQSSNQNQQPIIIQAMDTESFSKYLKRNKEALIGATGDLVNSGNSSFRSILKKGVS